MARGKAKGVVFKLVSLAGTGTFYTSTRNPRAASGSSTKLLLKKYDPVLRQHTLFKEEKISRAKPKRK
jgi:large subunit ribosomal protein L33